jgi:hypothetical protein
MIRLKTNIFASVIRILMFYDAYGLLQLQGTSMYGLSTEKGDPWTIGKMFDMSRNLPQLLRILTSVCEL